MKKTNTQIISLIAAGMAVMMISVCSAQAMGAPAETEAAAATTAVTALETTEDSRAETSAAETEDSETSDVEVYHGEAAVQMIADDTVSFGCNTGECANSVFIISVEPDTPDETMNELFEKYDLDIVYDYENFNMYAVSVSEPLDAEQTDSFIKELEQYDYILAVEPDSVVYLDSSAEVQ